MIDFPEGIELYEQIEAPPHMDGLRFTLLPPPDGVKGFKEYHPLDLPQPRTIEIHRMRGSCGWSEELRVLVLFDGATPPILEKPTITDSEISLECASGDRILGRERHERFSRWMRDEGCDL